MGCATPSNAAGESMQNGDITLKSKPALCLHLLLPKAPKKQSQRIRKGSPVKCGVSMSLWGVMGEGGLKKYCDKKWLIKILCPVTEPNWSKSLSFLTIFFSSV